jgi:TolB-like protein
MHYMLSGQSPFAGDTVSDMLAAVLTREPRRLTEVPAGLADIVSKTLQKDTRQRYRSAGDLLRDLRAFRQESDLQDHLRRSESTGIEATPGRSGTRHSIAVLPFTNMSADADNEYFCDGLAEELLNALSKIDDLKVAARTSAFLFKGKSVNVSEIGARLSVNHILEGSVRRSGNRLRISVQLVNASDGFHLWSERYDSEMRDIFDVQDEIALAVVGALKVTLFGAEKAALLKRRTEDAAVHELFLKGRYYSSSTPPRDGRGRSNSSSGQSKCSQTMRRRTLEWPPAMVVSGFSDCFLLGKPFRKAKRPRTRPWKSTGPSRTPTSRWR